LLRDGARKSCPPENRASFQAHRQRTRVDGQLGLAVIRVQNSGRKEEAAAFSMEDAGFSNTKQQRVNERLGFVFASVEALVISISQR